MSEDLNEREIPAEWFAALNDARPAHQPKVPTLILPGFGRLETFAALDQLAARLVELLEGRRPVLVRSVAAYPGFDSFPAWTIHAEGPRGDSGGPPGCAYVATIGVQRASADQVLAALTDAEAQRVLARAAA